MEIWKSRSTGKDRNDKLKSWDYTYDTLANIKWQHMGIDSGYLSRGKYNLSPFTQGRTQDDK